MKLLLWWLTSWVNIWISQFFFLSLSICLFFIPLSRKFSWMFVLLFHWFFFPQELWNTYILVSHFHSICVFMDKMFSSFLWISFKILSWLKLFFVPCAISVSSKFHFPSFVSHVEEFLQVALPSSCSCPVCCLFLYRVRHLKAVCGFSAEDCTWD